MKTKYPHFNWPQAITPALFLSVLLLIPQTGNSEIYKWRDADGNLVYSDKPPPDQQQATEISGQLEPINRDSSHQSLPQLQQTFKGATPEEAALQQQKKQQLAQQRQQQCDDLRERLKTIKGRVNFYDRHGNLEPVTEQQRAARAKQLEQQIRKRCG